MKYQLAFIAVILAGCYGLPPQPPEEWIQEQTLRCETMDGESYYGPHLRIFECLKLDIQNQKTISLFSEYYQ
jgi:hypothetical protein